MHLEEQWRIGGDDVELLIGRITSARADADGNIYLLDGRLMQVHVIAPDGRFLRSLSRRGEEQAYFEVKTRTKSRRGSSARFKHEPISLFLTIRRYGPVDTLDDLGDRFSQLAEKAENLATDRFVPLLLTPIAREITSSAG